MSLSPFLSYLVGTVAPEAEEETEKIMVAAGSIRIKRHVVPGGPLEGANNPDQGGEHDTAQARYKNKDDQKNITGEQGVTAALTVIGMTAHAIRTVVTPATRKTLPFSPAPVAAGPTTVTLVGVGTTHAGADADN